VDYADGEVVWIFDTPNWEMYVFRRTSVNDVDGGEWHGTGVTTTSVCADW
jgi:hypothetical protein